MVPFNKRRGFRHRKPRLDHHLVEGISRITPPLTDRLRAVFYYLCEPPHSVSQIHCAPSLAMFRVDALFLYFSVSRIKARRHSLFSRPRLAQFCSLAKYSCGRTIQEKTVRRHCFFLYGPPAWNRTTIRSLEVSCSIH